MLFNEDIANVKENIQAQLNNFKAEEQDDQMLDQQDNMIQFSHFLQIILSVRNSIFDPKKEIQNTVQNINLTLQLFSLLDNVKIKKINKIKQEADQPLNNFFICAAKNIYKYNPNISKIISVEYIVEKFQVNDQNTSYENPEIDPCKRISKEIISQNLPLFYVLLKGYRYLNFEIWEGPKNGEPVIKSGFDGQQNILFADILVILVQYAFFQTSNPLILHLDLHLSTASNLPYNYKEILKYPSLEEFQYRILVSGIVFNMEELVIPQGQKQISLMSLNKFDYEISKIDNLLDSCNQIQDYDSNQNEEKQQTQISQLTSKSQAYQQLDVQTQIQMEYIDFQPQSDEIDKDMQKFTNEEENYDKKKQMAIQNFFDNNIIKKPRLKHYLESIYEDVETKRKRIESQKRRSKVAPPIIKTAAQNLISMKNFNKLFITKVDNTQKNQNQVNFQISDGNFKIAQFKKQQMKFLLIINFKKALRQGCQIILNNPLTFDLNNLIYESFFQQNGNNKTGFVLKPEFLRQHQYNNINNESSLSDRSGKEMNLKIEVFVKRPIQLKKDLKMRKKTQLDKYVQNVNEYNWQKEHISEFFVDQEYFKEEIIGNNNVNPKLQLQFQFSVKKPQFSFLCFQVIDTNQSNLIGWYALPCNCIRQGYRVIPLKDELFNTINNSYIFCKVQYFVNQ
ncbi:PLC-like phosphodiesterase, TIM beta/alpha-barrel domain [Pseudocohnilembus persalinus]|uniref:phosphoinositide phospholipase C n=1 Tax=Pseudocohnilembus persalinus TaxID=266149 RepID=A0A0V0QKL5_PSEPJ|nr:PLC-like phosphodiesterase, TIM beta/alpha-barrel domain [Pseudocohnilembus persalinus]|eukprot:KRX02565.1 PLC-like phosphodiesterase, TIM beta/alpha-barrel domain [Pseudocohnilembus persalinus]